MFSLCVWAKGFRLVFVARFQREGLKCLASRGCGEAERAGVIIIALAQ